MNEQEIDRLIQSGKARKTVQRDTTTSRRREKKLIKYYAFYLGDKLLPFEATQEDNPAMILDAIIRIDRLSLNTKHVMYSTVDHVLKQYRHGRFTYLNYTNS